MSERLTDLLAFASALDRELERSGVLSEGLERGLAAVGEPGVRASLVAMLERFYGSPDTAWDCEGLALVGPEAPYELVFQGLLSSFTGPALAHVQRLAGRYDAADRLRTRTDALGVLGLLLDGGVSLFRALAVVERAAPDTATAALFAAMAHSARGGGSLADAAAEAPGVSPEMCDAIGRGERDGSLPAVLVGMLD